MSDSVNSTVKDYLTVQNVSVVKEYLTTVLMKEKHMSQKHENPIA